MNKILTLLMVTGLALNAQTFNVSNTAEFREALQNAAMNGENDTIVLADGTYKTTDDDGGRFEYLDNEVYDLTLIGSSRENVILSGDGQNNIFRHQSIAGADLKVEKLSFIDGGPILDEYGYRSNDGGAIYTEYATIDIIDCNFTNNHARFGGAIYSGYDAGSTNVSNTIFSNNTALNGGGFFANNYSYNKKVMVDNSTFINNRSISTDPYYKGGGGFFAGNQLTAVVSDSNFTNNISGTSGGGFYSDYAEVSNSNFIKNEACVSDTSSASNGTGGGGFKSSRSAKVVNSKFDKNVACSGGGFSSYDTTIIGSVFTDNNATDSSGHGGGGFSSSFGYVSISKSTFSENYSKSKGGGFVAFGAGSVITNSIFTNNKADGLGAGLYAGKFSMSNSIIAHNTNGVYLYQPSSTTDSYIIKNNIFIDNYIQDVSSDPQSDISGHVDAIAVIDNNYIDTHNIHVQDLSKNNIFANVTLGFVDAVNNDYHLTSSSDLIDAGTSDYADRFIVDGVNYLERDLDDNNRSVGANMDMGVYEYSTTKPTIIDFTFTGEAKEYHELTFNVTYNLTSGRTVQSVEYDYMNDGNFETSDTHTYIEAKTYTVHARVTDDAGESSLRTIRVQIENLPYDDMTDEQKIKEAVDPRYYDDVLSIINQNIEEATNTGKQYVLDNPEEFDLFNQSQVDIKVQDAINACKNNPASCDIKPSVVVIPL